MMDTVIQIHGTQLSSLEIQDICQHLSSNTIRLLSLRQCSASDKDYKALIKALGQCKSILQINFNLGLVSSVSRIKSLSSSININRSLNALFLHGSKIGDKGMVILGKSLGMHPNITSLDLGDCQLSNASIPVIGDLLSTNGAKMGLKALTLTANRGITKYGWSQFFQALSAGCELRSLHLDYNRLEEMGVASLCVALAHNNSLQTLDLEATGVTDKALKNIIYLLKHHRPKALQSIALKKNPIKKQSKETIKFILDNPEIDISITDADNTNGEKENKEGYFDRWDNPEAESLSQKDIASRTSVSSSVVTVTELHKSINKSQEVQTSNSESEESTDEEDVPLKQSDKPHTRVQDKISKRDAYRSHEEMQKNSLIKFSMLSGVDLDQSAQTFVIPDETRAARLALNMERKGSSVSVASKHKRALSLSSYSSVDKRKGSISSEISYTDKQSLLKNNQETQDQAPSSRQNSRRSSQASLLSLVTCGAPIGYAAHTDAVQSIVQSPREHGQQSP